MPLIGNIYRPTAAGLSRRGKDSAREIRDYFIPDFSNWKDYESYQKAFQRLVGDLKALVSGHGPEDMGRGLPKDSVQSK
jgi:hypothetical protein